MAQPIKAGGSGKGGGEPAGMDRAGLRRMMKFARDEPVHVAFALDRDGHAVVQMDRRKPPRTLEKTLKESAPDSRNHRFGTAEIDPEDPKRVRFVVNKAGGGLARKLVIALKGTGFSKVQIVLDDGTQVEEDADEDAREDEDADEGDEAASPAEPDTTAQALARELTGLVRQMLAVIAADPSQKAALTELATEAQASLKRHDLEQAEAAIDILRLALAAESPAGPPADRPSTLHPQTASKARHIWVGTRQRVDTELDKLRRGIEAHYQDHPGFGDIQGNMHHSLQRVLHGLDETLADQLAELESAAADEHADRLAEVRATLRRYHAFVASSPLIQEIDDNPFAAVHVRKTIEASLAALSRSIG